MGKNEDSIEETWTGTCAMCDGSGSVECPACNGEGGDDTEVCFYCDGQGGVECLECDGEGEATYTDGQVVKKI